jgi:C-terminal processing protease CtpA/Prc
VAAVAKFSPAARAGIAVGDRFVEVDGVAVRSVADAMKLIPGSPGTMVRLKVLRGAEYRLFEVTRQAE